MIAITQACASLGSKWLAECAIYVTIEPCSMCAGALVLSRIKNIFFGAKDPKTGACGSIANIVNHKKLNHRVKVKKKRLAERMRRSLERILQAKAPSAELKIDFGEVAEWSNAAHC